MNSMILGLSIVLSTAGFATAQTGDVLPNADDVVAKMVQQDAQRKSQLSGYTATRHYVAANEERHTQWETSGHHRHVARHCKDGRTVSSCAFRQSSRRNSFIVQSPSLPPAGKAAFTHFDYPQCSHAWWRCCVHCFGDCLCSGLLLRICGRRDSLLHRRPLRRNGRDAGPNQIRRLAVRNMV